MSNLKANSAIITVTYNSEKFIVQFLQSVQHLLDNTNRFILICVDNKSQDKTVHLIKEFQKKEKLNDQLFLVLESENLGFGTSCNRGVEFAKQFSPDYLWFLNPDTEIDEKSALAMLNLYTKENKIDFVGSILKNQQGIIRSGAFRFPGIINTFLSQLRLGLLDKIFSEYTTAQPILQDPSPADWITGASFMAKTEVFESLGGFDTNYFLYFEEVDLFLRARRAGYTIWTCPHSCVFHISGASTGMNKKEDISQQKPRPKYWFESRRYFYIKNFGLFYFFLVDLAFFAGQMLWFIRCLLQQKKITDPPNLLSGIFQHCALFPKSNQVS